METNSRMDISSPEFRTDEFRMYGLKVIECSRRHSHDWTTCPFAHPNEKARRRDPRRVKYTGVACPYIRQGQDCPSGEYCSYAHNIFEYWLHPSRYRTQLCNIAASCNRNVCFFAHSIEELRVPHPIGSPDTSLFGQGSMNLTQSLFFNPGDNPSTNYNPNLSMTSRAQQVLDQLLAARQLPNQIEPTMSSDLSEIQTLISLLHNQQRMAGISNMNPPLQSQFLHALLSTLFDLVCMSVMQTSERERLLKLLRWIYVQVVQNNQSSIIHNPGTIPEPFPRHSLTRIPETVEAYPIPLPQISSFQPAAASLVATTANSSLDGSTGRSSLPGFPIHTGGGTSVGTSGGCSSGGTGDVLRISDESSGTMLSGNARLSLSSLNRSSNESYQSDPFILLPRNQFTYHHPGFTSPSLRHDQEDASQIPVFIYSNSVHPNQPSTSGI